MTITLKTLPDATAQQVFDQVAAHLLTQNRKSRDASVSAIDSPAVGCRYRYQASDGTTLMCAAGCLIADDEYDPSMEDRNWLDMTGDQVPDTHRTLIADLQSIHDTHDITSWRKSLALLADALNLNDDILETIPA